MNLFTKMFGTYSDREVRRIKPIVKKINSYDKQMEGLSDLELRSKTDEFKNKLSDGQTLDDILPEAFSVVREASMRVLGLKHYDEQCIGGIILHQSRIAEMKTGEGKTLVATLPAYLNALTEKGVHIVTVNDYLAQRDKEWMEPLYNFLGLSVGVILHSLTPEQRKEAYNCDITYGTNSEFGFDYLKDNMVIHENQKVQRELNFAIVDEIDSILIDEARTPLIISGKGDEPIGLYKIVDLFVKQLEDEDISMDKKTNSVTITTTGIEKIGRAHV